MLTILARIFLLIDLQTYCNFPESRKKYNLFSKIVFVSYLPPLNINCFVEKNHIFLRFCLCIFESDTVKSDCQMQIFRRIVKYFKIQYRLLVYFTSFTVFFLR